MKWIFRIIVGILAILGVVFVITLFTDNTRIENVVTDVQERVEDIPPIKIESNEVVKEYDRLTDSLSMYMDGAIEMTEEQFNKIKKRISDIEEHDFKVYKFEESK